MWPSTIKTAVLVACGRRCAICHKFCGMKMECHHIVPEAEGGPSTFDNCIPLCFDCHADVGSYNPRHPKGTRYTTDELKGHRDNWFKAVSLLAEREREPTTDIEVYENQIVDLVGFVWRETFPGRPDYSSFETDEHETYWMLVLAHPVTLVAIHSEHGGSYKITGVKRLQMSLTQEQYDLNRHLVLCDTHVRGRLFPSHTGHHHGDANIVVEAILPVG